MRNKIMERLLLGLSYLNPKEYRMNCFMDKLHLMVKLKERIYELSTDQSKKEEVDSLKKLLKRIQNNPEIKSI